MAKKTLNIFYRILMTEAYTDIENTMLFYGTSDGSRLGAQFTFNFEIISYLDGTSSARDFVDIINKWLAYMPVIYTPNWVVSTLRPYMFVLCLCFYIIIIKTAIL